MSLAPMHLPGHLCHVCGRPIDVHQKVRGSVCDEPDCQRQHVLDGVRQRRLVVQAAVRRVTEYAEWLCAQSGEDDASATTELVGFPIPANGLEVGPLPEERREQFRERLVSLIEEAATLPAGDPQADRPGDASEEGTPAERVLRGACATCRGFCCRAGGTKAYLNPGVLRTFQDRHPDLTPEQVRDRYLSRLPETSYRDSCVFHTEAGCELPREMRSDTCNEFYCDPLLDHVGQAEWPPTRPRLAVALNGTTVIRTQLLTLDGRQTPLPVPKEFSMSVEESSQSVE